MMWLDDVRDVALADAAIIYARSGWRIFPCIGKDPLTAHGFHDASADESQVRRWWRQWPTANIAGALPEGTFAIDEDPRKGGDFARTMLELARGPLPLTLRQLTGADGYHWIYRVPAGASARQGANVIGDGLDTRVSGKGYLMLAPSVHPETGNRWRWNSIIAPVEAPAWLLDLVAVKSAPARQPYTPPTRCHPMILDRRQRYARRALELIAAEVAHAPEGARNDTLNKAWWRILQFRDVVPEPEARAVLEAAAASSGLPEREIAKVLR